MAMRSKIRDSTNIVRRYWPGKAPQWADDHDTSFSDEDEDITILSRDISFPTRDDDPRPSSLAEMRISNHDDDHRRHIRSAEIFDTTEEEEEEEEEAMDERRRRIKERVLRQREQEEEDVYTIRLMMTNWKMNLMRSTSRKKKKKRMNTLQVK